MRNPNLKNRKVLLFYNPTSGDGLFKNNLDLVISKFQAKKLVVVPVRSGKPDYLDAFFQAIDPKEYVQVVVSGGDGTINTCVNSMIRNNINLPLAIFPTGTANDFAYYFALSPDTNKMIEIALGHHYTYADVGVMNGKYFINVAAIGALVDVSQKTDPTMKNTLGVVSYYLKGISEVPNLKPINIDIKSAEYTGQESIFFMLVMNGRSAGGFKRISPTASINDGLLDVMIFREMPIIEFAPLLVSVMQGNHQDNKNVLHFKTSKLELSSDTDISTDVDGEKGEKFPLTFEVLPKRLKILTEFDDMQGVIW